MAYSMIITACPCREDAKALAQTLVKEKLAACVQIQDIESFFTWQGKVENSSEALLFIKTKSKLYQKVEEAIRKSHKYEVPEIIELPITNGLPSYLKWLDEATE